MQGNSQVRGPGVFTEQQGRGTAGREMGFGRQRATDHGGLLGIRRALAFILCEMRCLVGF